MILDGEAQFTIDGRTATVKGPAGVLCRAGHSHAIYNPGTGAGAVDEPERLARRRRVRQLRPGRHARRRGARSDSHLHDPAPGSVPAESRRRTRPGGAGSVPDPKAVLSRRALGPAVFSTTWSYIDHVLVPPGGSTPDLAHDHVGEAYYVLGGEGTVTVKGAASETAPVRAGDAIPVRLGETSRFTNSGSAPLELFVMGVARDMAAKTQLLTGAPR